MTEVEEELRYRLPDLFVYLDTEKSIDELDYDTDPDAEDKFQSLLKTNTSYYHKLNSMIEESEKALVRYTKEYSEYASDTAKINAYDTWNELPWGDDKDGEHDNAYVQSVFVAYIILQSEDTVATVHHHSINEGEI
tara:strand:+ start:1088 stop:1495 length:408 start_codon:yes stop_codon:yes gene_type:complete